MELTIELDLEEDGRFIAEVPELPGVMVYGEIKEQAVKKVISLAFRVLADKVENEKTATPSLTFSFAAV